MSQVKTTQERVFEIVIDYIFKDENVRKLLEGRHINPNHIIEKRLTTIYPTMRISREYYNTVTGEGFLVSTSPKKIKRSVVGDIIRERYRELKKEVHEILTTST